VILDANTMAMRSTTRDVGQLSFRADVVPSTFDADKRTVQLTWTTGARVLRGYYDPYWEELSLDPKHVRMGRLQSGTSPLLNNHSSYSLDDVIGIIEGAALDSGGRSGSATVRFDRGPVGDDVMRKVGDGILRNVSVGYRTYKMQKVEDGDGTTPVYRAVDWEPYEISMVPMGADAGAGVRSAAAITNHCEFISEERAMEPVIPTVTTPAVPAAPAAPAAPNADQVRAAAATAERERVLGIQRVGLALRRPETEISAALVSGATLEAFRAAAVDALAAAPAEQGGALLFSRTDPRIQPGEDQRDKLARGMSAWLFQRAGQGRLVSEAAKARPDLITPRGETIDLDPGEFRGLTLVDMARRCLEAAGVRTSGTDRMKLIGQALTMRSPTASTSDFPIILENVLYKVLLAQYAITPDTWRMFCKVGSVTDFRTTKRYRLGTFGSLDALNELGEFKNKSIPDAERQSLTAATKGNIIGISRQTIINDDMGAFDTLASMFGRAAALSQEVDVYALIALNAGLGPLMSDGNTLFHATHNNISTGAAISSTAIDADRVAMASQKDPSNNEILALRPAILVLPVGLGGVARQINTSQYDFDASNKFQIPNKVGGLFRDIIDTPRVTGTRRYLFADPGVAPTIELAYVEGQAQPFMDQQQGWRVDGVEWKVRMDYGVAAIDFRGAVTNAGV
jgi:hypothetical protein